MKNKKKKLFFKKAASIWGHILLRILFSTCRYKELRNYNLRRVQNGPASTVLMCWHSHFILPFYYLRNRDFIPLIGTHSDAEILSLIGRKFGYSQLRGSSNRRAVAVAAEFIKILKQPGKVVMTTPDGPLGPAKKLKIGTMKIIQKVGAVIIPVGAASSRNRILKSWDRFHQPKAFSKIVLIFGEPIQLPENRKDCNFYLASAYVSEKINSIQKLAELEVRN